MIHQLRRRHFPAVGNGLTVPGGAAQWAIDPTQSGKTWFGWGADAQCGQESQYVHDANPSYLADAATAFLDEGFTWVGLSIMPGIIRADADYFQAWVDDGCAGGISSDQAVKEHKWWPIEGAYYWTQLDFYVPFVQEVRTQAALRGIDVKVWIKFNDYNPGPYTPPAGGYAMGQYPARYAALMLALWQHMDTTYGFVPDALDAINEPAGTASWGNTAIINAVNAALTSLNGAGYDPQIFVGSYVDPKAMSLAVFNQFNATSWADQWQPAMHAYGLDPTPATHYTELATVKSNVSGKGIGWINTEYPAKPLELVTAIYHGDLTGCLNYAMGWTRYAGDEKGEDNNVFYVEHPVFSLTKLDHSYGDQLIWRNIHEGDVRIAATKTNSPDSDNCECVAFKHANGKIVAVLVNHSTGQKYVIPPPGRHYKVFYQLGSENNPYSGQSYYRKGASDLVAGRDYFITNGQGLELTADTAGAAGTYALIEQ